MPLVILCGYPCSGKSQLAEELKEYFSNEKRRDCMIISDEQSLSDLGRNKLYMQSSSEKQLRGDLKSKVQRFLNKETVIILDASNYIKGYRYELYCLSKEHGTTHCIVELILPDFMAWERNQQRSGEQQYSKQVFDELIQRYEAPDSRNRWDTPHIACNKLDKIPFHEVNAALFTRNAPKPNQSTQSQPLSSSTFLYELDAKTKELVKYILKCQENGQLTDITIPKAASKLNLKKMLSTADLGRLRRQFLNYSKLHPAQSIEEIPSLFVNFINKSI